MNITRRYQEQISNSDQEQTEDGSRVKTRSGTRTTTTKEQTRSTRQGRIQEHAEVEQQVPDIVSKGLDKIKIRDRNSQDS